MSNPFDQLELARDLVRRDECERLFDEVNRLSKVWADLDWQEFCVSPEEKEGRLRGLENTMNMLDERIGWLRDRWG
jgi:hypothetical protein